MGKLIRRVTQDDLTETTEEIVDETTEETETVQVIEEPVKVNEPLFTSESKVDLTVQTLGPIKLDCDRCHEVLTIGRGLGVNLMCPSCGADTFMSQSNFRMECLDYNLTINAGDPVARRGRMIWKVT